MTTIAEIMNAKLGHKQVLEQAKVINQIVANAPIQRQQWKNAKKAGRRRDGKLIQAIK
jgi:hypothetical protein